MKNARRARGRRTARASRWRERLGGSTCRRSSSTAPRTRIFPVGHGEALAREIPGAELLVLEGAGHELPRRDWDVVVPGDPADHAGIVNVSGCEPSTSVKP